MNIEKSQTKVPKKELGKAVTVFAICLISLLCLVRIFSALQISAFNYDEHRRADTVREFITTGQTEKNSFKIAGIPIFVHTDAGFSSLPFLAPATVWATFFGTSPASLRIFIAILMTSGLLLLAHTISIWYGRSRKVFFISAGIGLSLPWLFLQGIFFWDTSLAPICFIIAFYAFTKIFHAKKHPKTLHKVLLPLSLITAVYLYLPSAIPAVILYFASLIFLAKKHIYKPKDVVINLVISALLSLPFVIFFLTFPGSNTRTGDLSVFSQTGFFSGIGRFLGNFLGLISPIFLFVTGDRNLHHSIGAFGMLGTAAVFPVVLSVYYRIKNIFTKNEKFLFTVSIIAIVAATVSSALTYEGQPHSLRSNVAAPFYVLLIVLGINKFITLHPKAKIPVFVIFLAATIAYLVVFFCLYPTITQGSFPYT